MVLAALDWFPEDVAADAAGCVANATGPMQ
jgi:hypothetical protein